MSITVKSSTDTLDENEALNVFLRLLKWFLNEGDFLHLIDKSFPDHRAWELMQLVGATQAIDSELLQEEQFVANLKQIFRKIFLNDSFQEKLCEFLEWKNNHPYEILRKQSIFNLFPTDREISHGISESWLDDLSKVTESYQQDFVNILDIPVISNLSIAEKLWEIRGEALNPEGVEWDDWYVWEYVFLEILKKFWDYRFWRDVLVTSISWPGTSDWTLWFKKIAQMLEISPTIPVILVDNKPFQGDKYDNDVVGMMQKMMKYPNVRVFSMKEFWQRGIEAKDAWEDVNNDIIRDIMMQNIIHGGRTGMNSVILDNSLSGIRHDLWHALNGSMNHDKKALIERARALWLTGTDEEIIDQVINSKINKNRNQNFMSINGAFVDWDGTLFQDGKFRRDIFKEVFKLSKERWDPLSIWTGWGDINQIYHTLEQNGIIGFNVCSKQDCSGIEVAYAFDDIDKEKLEEEYGVKIREFSKVDIP